MWRVIWIPIRIRKLANKVKIRINNNVIRKLSSITFDVFNKSGSFKPLSSIMVGSIGKIDNEEI